MANRCSSGGSYKFKYIYLVLGLSFVAIIIASYLLPRYFPQVFTESMWILITDPKTGVQSIEYISKNTAMLVIGILRDVFVTGLVGIVLYAFYEHRFENEEKQTLIDGVNQILSDNIEAHIVKAMLTSKEVNNQILSSETIDEILRNCLEKKVGDNAKADAIMKSLLENVINKSGTIRDLDVSITLSNFNDTAKKYSDYSKYRINYVIRYKATLSADSFIFMLTNSKSIQNSNLGTFNYCQFVDSCFSGSEVFFNINEITVEGQSLTRIGERITGADYVQEEYWHESCNGKKGQEVQVCYSVDFLTRKRGNHYSYFTPFMTNGVHLKFDVSATDIKRIKLLTYFNSGEKPTIIPATGTNDNPKTIEITLNDWVLPLSGAAFIWQFERK